MVCGENEQDKKEKDRHKDWEEKLKTASRKDKHKNKGHPQNHDLSQIVLHKSDNKHRTDKHDPVGCKADKLLFDPHSVVMP